jgi:tripartite-type tricarboxylate transporter receptor subunit TctC
MQPVVLVGIAWSASGVKSIADARQRTVIVSASGATGTSAIVPWALNRLAGTKFRVIRGYQSQRPQLLALERGEIQGIGSASLSDVLANADWSRNHRVNILYTIAQARSRLVPDAPAIVELAGNDRDRSVLKMLGSVADIGQTLMAPPGVPASREALLRQAFLLMSKDPEFRSEAQKIGAHVDPLSGADLAGLVATASNVSPDVLAELRDVTRPQ